MKEKIVFFGAGPFVLPILDILKSNFDLRLVITTEKNPASLIRDYCEKNKLPIIFAGEKIDETIINAIKKTHAIIGILAYFGKIIPSALLAVFPKGIINIHPSLLPKYRGPTPGQAAILAGEKTTGVTIIKLDEKVDHGPILIQQKENVSPVDTAKTLYERLFKIGAKLLCDTLSKYLKNQIKLTEQDHAKATFTKQLAKENGCIDINNPPDPVRLDRMTRAYYPWPGAWTEFRIKNSELRIIKLLPNGKIQIEGRRPMTYKDFINGYREEGLELLRKLDLY